MAISVAVIATTIVACGTTVSDSLPAHGATGTSPPPGVAHPATTATILQEFATFTAPDRAFRLDVPADWRFTAMAGGVSFAWGLSSVTVDSHMGTAAPSPDSARLRELPAIAASTPDDIVTGDATTIVRSSGPLVLLTYRRQRRVEPGAGSSVAESVARYEFFRAGRTVNVTTVTPVGENFDATWLRVTDSFMWIAPP